MNERYIELNSMYRNRNLWPLESEFEVPISQSGTKNKSNADDPVCLSTPLFSWTSNNLLVSNIQTYQIGGAAYIEDVTPIKNTTDPIILTIKIQDSSPQQLGNYYNTLVLYDNASSQLSLRRITNSSYLGQYSSGGSTWYRLQLTLLAYLPDFFNLGDIITISDPTDFSDPKVPLIFVPNGAFQDNAYISYILYNETCNQYRPILRYDIATNMIQLDTSGSATSTNYSGPITSSWQTTDNFSIRKEPPIVPYLGNNNPTVFNTITVGSRVITTDTSTIIVTGSGLSTEYNFYKNDFLRILPFGSSRSAIDERYEYEPLPSNNQSRKIIEYEYLYDDITASYYGVFKVYPEFNITYPLYDTVTPKGAKIEVLSFSYDNFNPFTYTGSLVSQQNMVCYEVQLLSLILPNAVLKTGEGGRIAFYPYVYVQLSNVSASNAGNKHIIYSNNPNSTNIVFIVPIFDVQNPSNTPFVRVTGANMTQTMKFKPNDNLYFKVILTNGNSYKTVLSEKFSPSFPNPMSQISAMFSFKRIQ
jgi:hypothetical protein